MLAQKWWIHFLLWSKLKSCYDWKYVVKSHLSKNWNSISKRVWPQFLTCCNETPTQNSGTNYPNRFQFFKTPNKQHHMFFNFQSDGIFKGVKCKYPGRRNKRGVEGRKLIPSPSPPSHIWKNLDIIKGQLISKCLLGVIVSTKKPTKFF